MVQCKEVELIGRNESRSYVLAVSKNFIAQNATEGFGTLTASLTQQSPLNTIHLLCLWLLLLESDLLSVAACCRAAYRERRARAEA